MGRILKVAIILMSGLLVYYYFFGTIDEKHHSQKVFVQIKEIGHSIGQVLVNEKQKISNGQYDDIFSRLGNTLEAVRNHIGPDDAQSLRKLEELETRKDALQKKQFHDESADSEQLKRELEDLILQTRKLFEESGSE